MKITNYSVYWVFYWPFSKHYIANVVVEIIVIKICIIISVLWLCPCLGKHIGYRGRIKTLRLFCQLIFSGRGSREWPRRFTFCSRWCLCDIKLLLCTHSTCRLQLIVCMGLELSSTFLTDFSHRLRSVLS